MVSLAMQETAVALALLGSHARPAPSAIMLSKAMSKDAIDDGAYLLIPAEQTLAAYVECPRQDVVDLDKRLTTITTVDDRQEVDPDD